MKKLKKLQINPEKLMKNEDLMTLKGGQYGECHTCLCNCDLIPEAWWACYCNDYEKIQGILFHCGSVFGDCTCSDYLTC